MRRDRGKSGDLVTVALTEEHVQPALLGGVAAQDDHGDEAQSGSRFPHLQQDL